LKIPPQRSAALEARSGRGRGRGSGGGIPGTDVGYRIGADVQISEACWRRKDDEKRKGNWCREKERNRNVKMEVTRN